MMMSPATYDAQNRASIARQIYVTTWRILPWFTLLAGLVSLVLVRVVLVTALNYGLSRIALDLVVRVLVLEVIPLLAAMYVAMRSALAVKPAVAGIHIPGDLDVLGAAETDRIRDELVPRVIAYGFSVLTMIVVSGLVTLLMAYLSMYGLSRWGFEEFTRAVSLAFDSVVALGFVLKVALFSLAVAVIPIASSLSASLNAPDRSEQSPMPLGTVRLVVSLCVIEGLALALLYV
jgi:phospholipid/cholesterol/gamma-HCH transport system permease protein